MRRSTNDLKASLNNRVARAKCWRLLGVVAPEFFRPTNDPTASLSISHRSLPCRRKTLNTREGILEELPPTHPPDFLIPKAQSCYKCPPHWITEQTRTAAEWGSGRNQAASGLLSLTYLPSASSTGTPAPHHRDPQRYELGCSSQRHSIREDYSPSEAGEPSQLLIHG